MLAGVLAVPSDASLLTIQPDRCPAPTRQPPCRRHAAAARAARRDNERPLVEDIRLLGRILGDVIREQEGVAAFELVERIRQLSVAFRREADARGRPARSKRLLKSLTRRADGERDPRLHLLLHLANIAEDRHHMRRRARPRARRRHLQEGSSRWRSSALAAARHRRRARSSQTLAHAYISPVLTAHPTEVQRKSILDAERDIAELLTRATRSRTRCPDALRRASWPPTRRRCAPASLQLWQTRLLRSTKLTVADEIENALSYYEAPSCARSRSSIAELEQRAAGPAAGRAASCAWATGSAATATAIPNVSAETLRIRAARASARLALRHYLTEVHELGARAVDVGRCWSAVTPEMQALADALARPQRAPRWTSPTGAR